MDVFLTLTSVAFGAGLTFFSQGFFFYHSARKERLWKVRDALTEFGAAGFAYLEAQYNIGADLQRQLNSMFPGSSFPSAMEPPASDEATREGSLFDKRMEKASVAYWTSRERLLASKARLYVLSADKDIQARVQSMWKRLLDMKPAGGTPPQQPYVHPQFATVQALMGELDEWLSATADKLPNLW
jgi:hypothetical protein